MEQDSCLLTILHQSSNAATDVSLLPNSRIQVGKDEKESMEIRNEDSECCKRNKSDVSLLTRRRRKNHIPRPMNPFMMWAKIERPRLSEKYPHMHNVELSKILGDQWKRMNEEEKKLYIDGAEKLKQQHAIDFPHYKYKPRRRSEKQKRSASVSSIVNSPALSNSTSFFAAHGIQTSKPIEKTSSTFGLYNNLTLGDTKSPSLTALQIDSEFRYNLHQQNMNYHYDNQHHHQQQTNYGRLHHLSSDQALFRQENRTDKITPLSFYSLTDKPASSASSMSREENMRNSLTCIKLQDSAHSNQNQHTLTHRSYSMDAAYAASSSNEWSQSHQKHVRAYYPTSYFHQSIENKSDFDPMYQQGHRLQRRRTSMLDKFNYQPHEDCLLEEQDNQSGVLLDQLTWAQDAPSNEESYNCYWTTVSQGESIAGTPQVDFNHQPHFTSHEHFARRATIATCTVPRRPTLDVDFDCFDANKFKLSFGDLDLLNVLDENYVPPRSESSSSSTSNVNSNSFYHRPNPSPLGAMASLAHSLPIADLPLCYHPDYTN